MLGRAHTRTRCRWYQVHIRTRTYRGEVSTVCCVVRCCASRFTTARPVAAGPRTRGGIAWPKKRKMRQEENTGKTTAKTVGHGIYAHLQRARQCWPSRRYVGKFGGRTIVLHFGRYKPPVPALSSFTTSSTHTSTSASNATQPARPQCFIFQGTRQRQHCFSSSASLLFLRETQPRTDARTEWWYGYGGRRKPVSGNIKASDV